MEQTIGHNKPYIYLEIELKMSLFDRNPNNVKFSTWRASYNNCKFFLKIKLGFFLYLMVVY